MNIKAKRARKKNNRIRLFHLILIMILLKFSYGYYCEFFQSLNNRIKQTKKEENLISFESLIRKQGFFNDSNYIAKYAFLKKEWNNQSVGGIIYNEKDRKTE